MPGIIDAHSHTAIEGSVNECTDVGHGRGAHRGRARPPRRQHLPPARGRRHRRSTCCTARATRSAARTRSSSCAGASRPRSCSSRARRAGSSSRWARTSKRSNFRVPGEPRYPGTRMGVEVVLRDALPATRGLQARVGRVRPQASRRAGPKAEKPVPPRRDLRLETLARHPRRQGLRPRPLLPRRRDPDADARRRRVRLQDPHVPARARGLQGRERDREARRGRRRPSSTGGPTRWRPTTRSPTTRRSWPRHGVRVSLNSDSDELARRLYWDAAKAVKYGGVERDARRSRWSRSTRPGSSASTSAWARSRWARTPTSRSSARIPSSPDARVEMTLVDGHRLLRPRARTCAARRTIAAAGGARVKALASRSSRSRRCRRAALAADAPRPLAIRGARVVTVSGPVIEKGTVVVARRQDRGGGRGRRGPRRARRSSTAPARRVYPGLIDGAHHARPHRDQQRAAATVDTTEVGDVNPQAKAWVALQPAQRAHPGRARQRHHGRADRAAGRPGLGPERAHPPRRHDARRAHREGSRSRCTWSIPTGRPPSTSARLFEEPELKTFDERVKEQKKNQEKELDRLAEPARGRQGLRAPRRRRRGAATAPEAGPAARGARRPSRAASCRS